MTTRFLLCAVLALGGFVATGRAGGAFEQGNDLYAAGKFTEAARAYESQAARGDYSANLFFNLANADHRLGLRGQAILNYRRALLLDPAHTEAGENLAFVRGAGELPPAAASSAPWAWAAAMAGWIGLVAGGRGAASKTSRAASWSLAAVCFLTVAGCVAAIRYWTDDATIAATAIVLDDKARAFYAPADSSAVVTALTAGGEVQVLADRGAWLYARLPNGARGWVPAASVERLVPRAG